MKVIVFCVVSLIIASVISTNADNQMNNDTHKINQMGYTM